jgi:haloacetate dehalogenase
VAFPGFDERRVPIGVAEYFVAEAGDGLPVLLLHGFPQTHACWHRVAPRLAASHRVVAVDLRGYGASRAPVGGPRGEGYSKREMAAELVELMGVLGHRRFAVVGHDRGARVAFRLALDHPGSVARAAVLNVVPTVEQFERMGKAVSLGYWPWLLLAQPAPLPERLLGADPQALLDHAFETWASDPTAIDATRRASYLAAMTPETIAAMCADYRASFHLDRPDDAADRTAGKQIDLPLLLVTGRDERQLADAPAIWSVWANNLQATTVPGGHFVPEEAPTQLSALLEAFLAGDRALRCYLARRRTRM